MLFLLNHFHVYRWLFSILFTEFLDNCQIDLLLTIVLRFNSFFCFRFHVCMMNCNSLYLNLSLCLDCLLNSNLLDCCDFLDDSNLLDDCGFFNNSCLLSNNSLNMSLLTYVSMGLSSKMDCLCLMNLFLRLNHFNIMNMVLVWLFLWEILDNSQGRLMVLLVKLIMSSTQM